MNNLGNRYIVGKIDSVKICNVYHKQFNFSSCHGIFGIRLIEGLGFNDNFIQTLFGYCPLEPLRIDQTNLRTCDVNNDITCPDTYDSYGLAILRCSINTSITKHNQKSNTVQLYPNPVSSELKIKETLPFFYYTITNNIGELILQGNYADKETINVSQISNGIYFISIYDKQGQAYQAKFIKQ